MNTHTAKTQRPSPVLLQRSVLDPECLSPEQQRLLEQTPELQAELRLERQLYWQRRLADVPHRQHLSPHLESTLALLLSGGLDAEADGQLWSQVETCPVCQGLTEEVGLDLKVLEQPLTRRGSRFMETRQQEWQARDRAWWEAHAEQADQEVLSSPARASAPPQQGPEPLWQHLSRSWQALSEQLRWSMGGLATACALVLGVILLRGPSGSEPNLGDTALEPWLSLQDRAGVAVLTGTGEVQAKGGTGTVLQPLTVSLSGELLMAGPNGVWEVVAPLDAVSRPRAAAPDSAQLRLRAVVGGTGSLTLWQVSAGKVFRLYDWPLARYGQESIPLSYASGERLAVELPKEQGSHVFVLTLSAQPVPSQAGQAWLENVIAGKSTSVALSRIIWDIR